jgi:type VI secretion system protein ImpF
VPELTTLERLQPSLLDRLTDDEPGQPHESRDRRFFTVRRLRAAVLRDLGWLLNATCGHCGAQIEDFDAAARSTLNYGIPDLAGVTASNVDADELARRVRQAIERFEPRILPATLSVRVTTAEGEAGPNVLTMRIEGDLWAVPAPLRILVNTSIDLESGRVVVADGSRAR